MCGPPGPRHQHWCWCRIELPHFVSKRNFPGTSCRSGRTAAPCICSGSASIRTDRVVLPSNQPTKAPDALTQSRARFNHMLAWHYCAGIALSYVVRTPASWHTTGLLLDGVDAQIGPTASHTKQGLGCGGSAAIARHVPQVLCTSPSHTDSDPTQRPHSQHRARVNTEK